MKTNSEYGDERVDKSLDDVVKIVDALRIELRRLREASLLAVGTVREFYAYPLAQELRNTYCTVESLEAAKIKSLPIVENNKAVAEHNRQLRATLEEILMRSNIPQSVRKWTGSGRSSKAVWGGWKDSTGAIPLLDNWGELLRQMSSKIDDIERRESEQEWQRQMQVEARANQEAQIRREALLLVLREKYGLPEYGDVLEEILKRNKYLMLGYWLERNRGDWSDGCDYAETGLRAFPVETDIDAEISAEINNLCVEWDGDGRCFRDCHWNYTRLFEMAEHDAPELMADYRKIREFRNDASSVRGAY